MALHGLLEVVSIRHGKRELAYSKSSPRPLEVPVLRACLPSTLSMVEYLSASIWISTVYIYVPVRSISSDVQRDIVAHIHRPKAKL